MKVQFIPHKQKINIFLFEIHAGVERHCTLSIDVEQTLLILSVNLYIK